jgi:hypothetical protein
MKFYMKLNFLLKASDIITKVNNSLCFEDLLLNIFQFVEYFKMRQI